MMMKKGKKINWKRGLSRSALCFSIIFLFILTVGFVTDSANAEKNQELIQIKVKEGDTLWVLADRYDNNNIDLRKYIYEIKEINEINDVIYPGQVLSIPIH